MNDVTTRTFLLHFVNSVHVTLHSTALSEVPVTEATSVRHLIMMNSEVADKMGLLGKSLPTILAHERLSPGVHQTMSSELYSASERVVTNATELCLQVGFYVNPQTGHVLEASPAVSAIPCLCFLAVAVL